MKVKSKEFAVSLARVVPILKARTTMGILTCVHLHATMGKLVATGTDLNAFGRATCPAEGELDPVCVDAASLNYLVRQAPEEVELFTDGKSLKVVGTGTANLNCQPVTEFPGWPVDPMKPLKIDPDVLAEAIAGVAWAALDNTKFNTELWKECVWVKGEAKKLQTAATDSAKLSYCSFDNLAAPAEFLLPAVQAKLLVDALNTGATGVDIGEKWIATQSDSFQVAIKLAEGKYAPIHFVLQSKKAQLGTVDPGPIVDSLHAIHVLGQGDKLIDINFAFNTDHIWIGFTNKFSQFEREVPFTLEGEPCKKRFTLEKATQVFAHLHPGTTVFETDNGLIFQDGDFTLALAALLGNHE